jgi:tetratricopeptide (TPR) repeat protein
VLLTALTWAFGAGFPEEEWVAVARALAPHSGIELEDVRWVLSQAGRFVLQDGEHDTAVYRMAHQSLADLLRPRYTSTAEAPFDPGAGRVTVALAERYEQLLDAGLAAEAPGYLWRYLWRHAAATGGRGLNRLRELAAREPTLAQDIAAAALGIAEAWRFWGRRDQALPPTEEAVTTYRDLAAANPAFRPNLAGSLNNLGNSYSELGRRDQALPPTEEAVTTYRDLAAANPAFLPNLAGSLTNLGNLLESKVTGEGDVWAPALEALPPAHRAVLRLLRAQSAPDPTPDAAAWIADALAGAPGDPALTAALREQARRHRGGNPPASTPGGARPPVTWAYRAGYCWTKHCSPRHVAGSVPPATTTRATTWPGTPTCSTRTPTPRSRRLSCHSTRRWPSRTSSSV